MKCGLHEFSKASVVILGYGWQKSNLVSVVRHGEKLLRVKKSNLFNEAFNRSTMPLTTPDCYSL